MFNVEHIRRKASNVKGGDNPPFTLDDFRAMYPHFWDKDNKPLVPQPAMDMFLAFADACVKKSRFGGSWEYCMCLFLAHFFTLHLQSMVDQDLTDAKTVIAAGQTRGLVSSKSVDGVSFSYDFSTAVSDLDTWAAWKLTNYGIQYATIAKNYRKGGMYVW